MTGSAPEPAAAPPPSSSEASPEQTPDALREVWNAEAHPDLPRWIETPPKRAQVAQTRLRERPLDAWRNVIRRINGSPFLRGENERGWRADPDWLLKSGTAAKVLEGKYDPAKNKAKKKQVDEADL